MIVEVNPPITKSAGDVEPGEVIVRANEYLLRIDHVDSYGDPGFVYLSSGRMAHPDKCMIVLVQPKAKVVIS